MTLATRVCKVLYAILDRSSKSIVYGVLNKSMISTNDVLRGALVFSWLFDVCSEVVVVTFRLHTLSTVDLVNRSVISTVFINSIRLKLISCKFLIPTFSLYYLL